MAAVQEQTSVSASAARRKILQAAVGCLCLEAGFDKVEEMALETLLEMMQSCK
jgi:Bromodomain associated